MRVSFLALCCAALAALGCGSSEKKGVVTGTLLKGGKPYTFSAAGLPPGDKGLFIVFERIEGGEPTSDGAAFDADAGTFRVPGLKGRGLAAGTYRISVHRGAHGQADEFKGAFAKGTSPLTIALSGSPADLEVDLDAKTVKAK